MSLKSFIAQRFLKRELARIASGKEGAGMKNAFDWVMRNKKGIAAVLGAIAAGLMAYTGEHAAQAHQWGGYLMYAVTYLGGAGLHASDDAKAVEQGKKEATAGGLVKS